MAMRNDFIDYYDPLHDEREERRSAALDAAFEAPPYTDYDPGQDYRLPDPGPQPGRCPACRSPYTAFGYADGNPASVALYVFCVRCNFAATATNLNPRECQIATAAVARRMASHDAEKAAAYAATNPDDEPPF